MPPSAWLGKLIALDLMLCGHAGDLLRSAYDGEEEPDTSFEIWSKPLVLQGQLGLKLSNGQVIFEHTLFQECSAPSRSPDAAPTAVGKHRQPPAVAAKRPSMHLWERAVSDCVGSQWWAQGAASVHTSSQQQHPSQAPRQRDSCARGQCTSGYQPGSTQDSAAPKPVSLQQRLRDSVDEDAAAIDELDGFLDSFGGPSPSRDMPFPMANGHRRAAKQAWGMCNGTAKRRGAAEDPAAGDLPAAAPVQEAKHVSILAALQSAKPAGLVDVWREAGQASHEAHTSLDAQTSSSSSTTSQMHTPEQQISYTTTSLQQTLPVRSQHPSAHLCELHLVMLLMGVFCIATRIGNVKRDLQPHMCCRRQSTQKRGLS